MKYKLGRNDKCYCEVGNKKYKKCCKKMNDSIKKPTTIISYLDECMNTYMDICKDTKQQNMIDDFIFGGDKNELKQYSQFSIDKPIKYVSHFKNLDEDLQRKLKVVFTKKPIIFGGCHYNSTYLTTLIDGVETIKGWVRNRENVKVNQYTKIKDIGNGLFIVRLNKNKWKKEDFFQNSNVDYINTKYILNENTKETFINHSWNKYGDKHFDITLKMGWESRDFDRWYEYYQTENKSTTDNEFKKTLIKICDVNNILESEKDWVKNIGYLDGDVVDRMGFWLRLKESYERGGDYDEGKLEYKEYNGNVDSMDYVFSKHYLGWEKFNQLVSK